ncbi:MAG: hypothetical protein DKM50_13880 [Candidatus Margulisiibacteriota bacterium]|nr:MAG: hypothetical protein A2X43_09055 [Candidatus Margulisbacteria bacterium GWD2_39_127]OGI03572.1 MAG: hypothetical protein A2X42_00895 [Candidatus Margulisbacteria bacterium GWF2_38_17]OGI11077.1 MAG: hypothetical protein A2X41_02190 [Candidatus Margulisbacteria bacterium GWE2_39_32]PZM77076.1 MAG: hypothetical protein DKM50_13880 [Candidatus Margulisiibacteriota bacterium]HAR62327.1 hypothetical protein [Candidatus Margulisiibacteriota bacterium]
MTKKLLQIAGQLVVILLLILSFSILYNELRNYTYSDFLHALTSISGSRIFFAALFSLLSYLLLTFYDVVALYYIRHPLNYGYIAFASFISNVFSINIGLSIFSVGAVKFRFYSAWGFNNSEITKVITFSVVTFLVGLLTASGIVFVLSPQDSSMLERLPFTNIRLLGIVLLSIAMGYFGFIVFYRKPITWGNRELILPSIKLVVLQFLLGVGDFLFAGSVLYVLLPSYTDLSYPAYLAIFLLAQIAGIVSHVPGGLGVFDTLILYMLSFYLPAPVIIGSLLLYRIIYFIIPLAIASILAGIYEVRTRL